MQLTTRTDRRPLADLRRDVHAALTSGPALAVLPDAPVAWQATLRRAVRPDRPVPGPGLVVPTSGSTGTPVGVVLSAAAATWSARRVNDRLGGPGGWVLALPPTHVAGVMVLARAVVADSPVVAASDGWAAALRQLPPGRRYTALVPTQVRRLLRTQPDVLAAFDAVLVGGAGLDPALRTRAARVGARLVESYGMTETCGGCVHEGRPLPGAAVRVAADGRIALAGPMLASAYRTQADDEPVSVDGWYTTGDLGQWHDGALTVLGRADDVVVSGGVSVSLAQVDALVSEHPELADAAAVGQPDDEWGTRVVVAAVPVPGCTPTLASVRAFVADRAEAAYVPRELVLLDDLGRPAPGKVDRAGLAQRLEEQR